MAKDPAFLFYPSDFITGTTFMNDEQVGKYIRLLCFQHQNGGRLTEKHMLHICKTYDKDIFEKFIFEDGFYFNERLNIESEKRKNYSESRANNRKKKKTESEHMKNISKTYVQHMENINENINRDINIIEVKDENKEVIKSNTRAKKFDFENELLLFVGDVQIVKDFMELRRKKKAVNSQTALKLIINECHENNFPVDEAIKTMIARNWQGFKVSWLEPKFQNSQPINKNTMDKAAEVFKNLSNKYSNNG